ncbi:phage tail protein [Pseudomonas sp. JL972]|uniref:phage tail protein n=1 Tax=Stutzerimonas degradans TaxID=2968968 RepID=UPI0012D91C6F|nr:phage tail protein [Stutzerimonas degradans]MTZ15111.1 phage tail protein [Stutzerimonas degradans]
MALETFTWSPRLGATGTEDERTRETAFADGYTQVVGEGINSTTHSWPLAFTGSPEYLQPIRDFLRRHGKAKAFLWTPPLGELGLYRRGEITLTGHGRVFTLAVTFATAYHP